LALDAYAASLLENHDQTVKDSLKRLEKTKKDAEAKAYLNPEIAEAHKEKGIEQEILVLVRPTCSLLNTIQTDMT
jgi:stress-induced-phosphoprotein 1